MKACVLQKNDQLVFGEHPLTFHESWYRIRVVCCGICGSDIGRAFRNGAYHYPLIMGHEFAGVVDAVPEGASGFQKGDRVTVYPLLPCGKCSGCQSGNIQLCSNYDYFGSRRDGGLAEFVYVPEQNLLKIPDRVSLEEAALTEPAAVAHHAIFSHPVPAHATALVIGGGPIGLLAAQWLRIRGCAEIAVADIDSRKTAFAESCGFASMDSRRLPAYDSNFDVCVEACGFSATRSAAIQCCARRGHVFLIGNPADDWTLERSLFSTLLRKELTLGGSWNSRLEEDWTAVMAYAGKELDLKQLITDRHPLERAPELFRQIYRNEGFHCKSLLFHEYSANNQGRYP